MKRLIAILMTAILVLALCACGSAKDVQPETAAQAETEPGNAQEAEKDSADASDAQAEPAADAEGQEEAAEQDAATEEAPAIIEFTDVVLVDDDTVKIELLNFFEREYNWNTGKQIEKCFTYKVKNKSDHELLIYLEDPYIDDEGVSRSGLDGVGTAPKPGKSDTYSYRIYRESPADKNGKALESLEDLYRLEATFEIKTKVDNQIVDSYDADFSLPAILGGEHAAPENEAAMIYEIGDTVSTDMLEFTLTGFDFVYHLDPKTYVEKDSIAGGSIGAGSDMVFANPEYTVKNIAKGTIKAVESVVFTVDYNDGYQYGMSDGNMCYIVDSPGIVWKWADKGVGQGASMTISPLSSEGYDAYIPANTLIDTDTEAPLLLIVSLASTAGTQDFIFQIR